jgi:hypothetical protein
MTTPGTAVQIDRMTMEISAVSAAEGRRIALLVAGGLAAAGALPAVGDIPAVRVELAADTNASGSELARRIIAATLGQLRRLP